MSAPCTRPECGSTIHTDGWGKPTRCPHELWLTTAEAAQITAVIQPPTPDIIITGQDGRPLVTIHPSGQLEYGPGYTPDEAARTFWNALRRLAPARCPACGHIGMETP
ncbi:hypothetical protein OG342_04740 [Streptomyces bobili]|uniref:hypothetical protein n=1 Tax=Streptomyces bobili TaxID=67280 RepID=UPI002259E6F9|nr:hypothetical protein [Streptomyces bobili]MCX5522175.1 hypothetical protein [Streptomyces bobili]